MSFGTNNFKVGDLVYHINCGHCEILEVDNGNYPIKIKYHNDVSRTNWINQCGNQILFHGDDPRVPQIKELLTPPKPPTVEQLVLGNFFCDPAPPSLEDALTAGRYQLCERYEDWTYSDVKSEMETWIETMNKVREL